MMDFTKQPRPATDHGDQPLLIRGISRLPQVQTLTGLSRSTIYRKEIRGTFPKRRRLGDNSVGWLTSEILDWIASTQQQQLAQPAIACPIVATPPAWHSESATTFVSSVAELQAKAKRPCSVKRNMAANENASNKETLYDYNKK
jgi:prophage regulatory protein